MKNTNKKTIGIIFAVLVAFVFSTVPVSAIENNGIGGRPANPRADNPRSESIFIYTITAGGTAQDAIRVLNNSDEEKSILVYATDSEIASGGAFTCKQRVEEKIGVGGWIKLEKEELTLKPYTNETVPFTLTTPSGIDVGEHNGCIVIEEKPKAAAMSKENSINLSLRSGIRVAVTVPGDIVRKAELVDFSAKADKSGKMILHPKMTNLGNVSLDASVMVVTKYFFGLKYQEYGGKYPIMAGQTADWNFEMERPFWGGFMKAEALASYDAGSAAGIGVASGNELKELKSRSVWFFVMPTMYALIIEIAVLLFVLLIIILLIIHSRQKKWVKTHWKAYTVKSGDDIYKLATHYSVSWKLIAKTNKIKPPYTLKSGTKILMPPPHKKA